MALSGSNNFTINEAEIIREALELTGVLDIGSGTPPEIYEMARRTLNIQMKHWQSQGLFLHTFQNATLFLTKGQASYELGPSGDHCTESYVETTLAADVVSGAGSVSLTSTTGMTNGDNIGIVLDDGTLFWTTITLPGTLAASITGDAASGNAVYAYTNKISRPLKVCDFRRLLADGTEIPINEPVSLEEYFRMPNKTIQGSIVKVSFDPQLTNSVLYVYQTASVVTEQLVFRYQKAIDDMEDNENDAEIPAEWYAPLTLMLADAMAPKLNLPIARQQILAQRALAAQAGMDDAELTSFFVEPRFQ